MYIEELGIRNSDDKKTIAQTTQKNSQFEKHDCLLSCNSLIKIIHQMQTYFSFLCKSKQPAIEATPNSHYSNSKSYLVDKNKL